MSEPVSNPTRARALVQYTIRPNECIVCAACVSIAPEIFRIDDGADTAVIIRQPASAEEASEAQAAAAACPVEAIVPC